ncbi:hypothetical protein LB503_005233 [Fusarium chuoi]|nr:hypothetical protein LB503_005233 [Fusarium chuoi]
MQNALPFQTIVTNQLNIKSLIATPDLIARVAPSHNRTKITDHSTGATGKDCRGTSNRVTHKVVDELG